jgi:hypothetical protein
VRPPVAGAEPPKGKIPSTVEEELRRIGVPEDADLERTPFDWMEDIVRPHRHPDAAALAMIPEDLRKELGIDGTDERFSYTAGGNLLTVTINVSYPRPMILKMIGNLLKTLDGGSRRGWNITKAPDHLKAWTLRKGGSTASERRKVAARIIREEEEVPSCQDCPKYDVCIELCPPLEAHLSKGRKSMRESTSGDLEKTEEIAEKRRRGKPIK